MEELLTTQEVCRRLKKNRAKVQQYREPGLLRMFKMGRGYVTTESELSRFMRLCVEYELDLSNPDRIILAGDKLKAAR